MLGGELADQRGDVGAAVAARRLACGFAISGGGVSGSFGLVSATAIVDPS